MTSATWGVEFVMIKTDRLSIGIDIVSVTEVSRAIERFGERYVRRIFTEQESDYCRAALGRAAAERFAARFAAKEAAIKTLRPRGPWTDWSAIEVHRHEEGWCDLILHREAAELAASRHIVNFELSMSHGAEYATAVVVAQAN